MSQPKIRKRCPRGHVMQVMWRSCPKCTGRPPVVFAPKSQVEQTLDDRVGGGGVDRTIKRRIPANEPRPRIPRLIAISSAISPREISLHPGRTKIGKAPSESPNHHRIAVGGDDRMSRNHALIEVGSDQVTISDAQSLNGTHVNGSRVDRVSLRDGDTVQLGESIFRFEMPS